MEALIVITVVAKDRPGLVESLAGAIARNGGNWLESRMSRLGGQFAGILRLSVPQDEREKLVSALRALEESGLKLTIQEDLPETALPQGRVAELSLVGQDRPGIVRQISEAFARAKVNVEELETECTSAAMSGETLFHATARIQIPPACDTQNLRGDLEKIAADLMVDVRLTELANT
jgi:glycine cleavage system regulatory protein